MKLRPEIDEEDEENDVELLSARELEQQIKKEVKSRMLKKNLLTLLRLSMVVAEHCDGYSLNGDEEHISELYEFLS